MAVTKNLDRLRELNQRAQSGGGEQRASRQHEQGKLLARERLDILLDSGSFVEMDRFRMHTCTDFGMDQQRFRETRWLPATEPSMAGWSMPIPGFHCFWRQLERCCG